MSRTGKVRPARSAVPSPSGAPANSGASGAPANSGASGAPANSGASGAVPSSSGAPANSGAVPKSVARRPAPVPSDSGRAPHVVIIGGGGTGGALAHDLALRGLHVTLFEKGEVTSGATGLHQGLLQSGARYATTDRPAAIESSAENKILRRICPGSFEEDDGLFVAITDEDEAYGEQFLDACWQSAVPAKRVERDDALRMEPGLSPALRFAVQVSDATMDAMRLPLRFFATAQRHGAEIKPFTEVVALTLTGSTVSGVKVRDHAAGMEYEVGADVVINAAGAWAERVAALAGATLPITLEAGVMVAVRGRHSNMVVNRLHSPGDGDLVVPQRTMTVVGTKTWTAGDPEELTIPDGAVEWIVAEAATLLPAIGRAEVRARWAAAQPVIVPAAMKRGTGRAGAKRATATAPTHAIRCIDHATQSTPIEGFVTVVGGDATRLRAAAEAAADMVCAKLGFDCFCQTADYILLPHTAWYSA
jgi:glycerol-3-phosphate dehydrogenase